MRKCFVINLKNNEVVKLLKENIFVFKKKYDFIFIMKF